jgi:hypothetical protein
VATFSESAQQQIEAIDRRHRAPADGEGRVDRGV